jgi:hypothetical protein
MSIFTSLLILLYLIEGIRFINNNESSLITVKVHFNPINEASTYSIEKNEFQFMVSFDFSESNNSEIKTKPWKYYYI